VGYEVLALNNPVIARNCLSQAQGKGNKASKKRRLEERMGGALSAAAAGQGSGGLPPPPPVQWVQSITATCPNRRILQRLTVIFSEINDLQQVVSYYSSVLSDFVKEYYVW
jgi:hypothetical protein